MRFELIGKVKSTLIDIDIQSLKQGQTDLKPAVALTFKVPMAIYRPDTDECVRADVVKYVEKMRKKKPATAKQDELI